RRALPLGRAWGETPNRGASQACARGESWIACTSRSRRITFPEESRRKEQVRAKSAFPLTVPGTEARIHLTCNNAYQNYQGLRENWAKISAAANQSARLGCHHDLAEHFAFLHAFLGFAELFQTKDRIDHRPKHAPLHEPETLHQFVAATHVRAQHSE